MERINATTGSYNFIDLFAGAGGLSEGFIQAGFSPVAHVEMNPYAAQTLETRTGYYYLKAQGKLDIYKDYISGKITRDEFLQHIPEEQLQSVFCETMSNETLPRLFENIDRILTQRGIKQVDVIIGGPPCQAYSLVGRAQSKHMETPMSADPRNDLYKLYARFLQKYHPKMFVFENVLMHTFAHLLIKQMSMSSGYSSSAIRERIYFGDDMSGVLLYTGSADKEGSLGGLVELGNIDQLIVLMKDAFQEALVCTNDPECLNNVPAGNNSNGAACHSCCMISETACENGNRMLDRGLIVPIDGRENQSYFKTLVEELCQLEV